MPPVLLADLEFTLALQHYLPASFLGGFSADSYNPRRDRRLHVLRRSTGNINLTAAEKLAARNDYYNVTGTASEPALHVDEAWKQYEAGLSGALDLLTKDQEADVPAETWLETLVPFVAALFVRGPDFALRFEALLGSAVDLVDPDNTNQERLWELQRLLALVMVSRWVVMRTASTDEPCLVSDIAYSPFCMQLHPVPGLAIPLGSRHVLGLFPQMSRDLLMKKEDHWVAKLEHVELPVGDARSFNEALSHCAREFVAGPTRESVEGHADILTHPVMKVPGIKGVFPVRPRLLVAHEFEWHRLVSAHRSGHLTAGEAIQGWDAKHLVAAGSPKLFLPTNLPDFPTGLACDGTTVRLTLQEVPGFTDA